MTYDDHSEDNLDLYLETILRIYEEIASDPERYQKLKDDLKRMKHPRD